MLTPESIGKFYKDYNATEYICINYIEPCCSKPYFLLKEFDGYSIYPYNAKGQRLDHKLQVVLDSTLNLTEG